MNTELTPKGATIMQRAREDYLTGLERKALKKALKHKQTTARMQVVGDADRLSMIARGWTVESDNSYQGGVYREWFHKAIMTKDILQIHLDGVRAG